MSLSTLIDRIDELVIDRADPAVIRSQLLKLRERAKKLELQVKTTNKKAFSKKLETAIQEETEKLQLKFVALEAKAKKETQQHKAITKTVASLTKEIEELQEETERSKAKIVRQKRVSSKADKESQEVLLTQEARHSEEMENLKSEQAEQIHELKNEHGAHVARFKQAMTQADKKHAEELETKGAEIARLKATHSKEMEEKSKTINHHLWWVLKYREKFGKLVIKEEQDGIPF